ALRVRKRLAVSGEQRGRHLLCRIFRLAGYSARKGHGVGCSGPDNASFPACITNNSLQLADWFVVPDVLDCNACGNRLSDPNSLDETPVRFEKNRAWSREIFRNNGIQEACGDPALYDETTEWRIRRQLDIVMDRVFVARHLSEHFDIAHCGRAAPLGAGTQRGLAGEGSCPRRIVRHFRTPMLRGKAIQTSSRCDRPPCS